MRLSFIDDEFRHNIVKVALCYEEIYHQEEHRRIQSWLQFLLYFIYLFFVQ